MKKKKLREEVVKEVLKAEPAKRSAKKKFNFDLRIQSPAALGYFGIQGIDTAPALIRLARVKGLDAIAITDFYDGRYVDRLKAAGEGTSIAVIPGVSIRAALGDCRDVVLLCFFSEQNGSDEISLFLHDLGVFEEDFGNAQRVVTMPFEQVLSVLDEHQGIAIPSRMDKTPSQMGAIPSLVDDYGFRAFDLAHSDSGEFFKQRWPKEKFSLFSFSNAMALAQVGSRVAKLATPDTTFASLTQVALRSVGDRHI